MKPLAGKIALAAGASRGAGRGIALALGDAGATVYVAARTPGAAKSNVAVVGLNPGFMRTESVLQYMSTEKRRKQFRFDLSESPEYIGRAVAALAADRNVMQKTGQLLWVADLAHEYGFTDIDGRYIPHFDPKAPFHPPLNANVRS